MTSQENALKRLYLGHCHPKHVVTVLQLEGIITLKGGLQLVGTIRDENSCMVAGRECIKIVVWSSDQNHRTEQQAKIDEEKQDGSFVTFRRLERWTY